MLPRANQKKNPSRPRTERPRKSRTRCPICDVKVVSDDIKKDNLFPFCSPRCKNIDLKRWFNGDYCISRDITPEDLENSEEE